MSRPYQQKRQLLEEHLGRDCASLVEEYLRDDDPSAKQKELWQELLEPLSLFKNSIFGCKIYVTVRQKVHWIQSCGCRSFEWCSYCDSIHRICICHRYQEAFTVVRKRKMLDELMSMKSS
jgi:hypothetical protein